MSDPVPLFSRIFYPKIARTHQATPFLVCNFRGHPPLLVHTGSADPGETGLFLQPLQPGFVSCLKRSWSLWLISCMAGVGKEHSSVLSPTPLTFLPQLWTLLASQANVPCPGQEERGRIHLFTISLLRREATSFPFCLCPPLLLPIQKALLKIGGSCTNLCLIIWIMGRCLWSPKKQETGFPRCYFQWNMKCHSKMVFYLSSHPHHLLWFRVWNGFTGSPVTSSPED